MKHDKFWMVWNPNGRAPTHKHWKRVDADREATRLAKCNPDQQFFVLKSVGGFTTDHAPVKPIVLTISKDNIPF